MFVPRIFYTFVGLIVGGDDVFVFFTPCVDLRKKQTIKQIKIPISSKERKSSQSFSDVRAEYQRTTFRGRVPLCDHLTAISVKDNLTKSAVSMVTRDMFNTRMAFKASAN